MFLNRVIKAESIIRSKLGNEAKDMLAKRLVEIDDTYKPEDEFIEAKKVYDNKGTIQKTL